jgi:hypothetical protein
MANSFDLSLLSFDEFEHLSKDILEVITKRKFRIFSDGKDKGIDVDTVECDYAIVAQCKHYEKSGFSKLLSSVKDSVESTKKAGIHPRDYYLFTSETLTEEGVKKLFDACSCFMKSPSFIYSRKEIEDYLNPLDKDGIQIIRKNPKLLGNAALFFNSKWNLSENSRTLLFKKVEKYSRLFVKTNVYEKASKALYSHHGVVLVGRPGSGKTITSTMLIADFLLANDDAELISSEHTDLKEAFSIVSSNKKQLFFLDDMLGSIEYQMSTSEASSIERFLTLASKFKNTYFIINSRQTIWEDCKKRGGSSLIEAIGELPLEIVDCNELSEKEKEKILYEHLFNARKNIPIDKLKDICLNRRFKLVTSRSDFSPRIIENAVGPYFLSSLGQDDYTEAIINSLEHPEEIWKDHFNNRLSSNERCLLYVLASYGYCSISQSRLEESFTAFANVYGNIDSSKDVFTESISRLCGELVERITTSVPNKTIRYSFANPSIYEVVWNEMKKPTCKKIYSIILAQANAIDQLVTLIPSFWESTRFKSLMSSGKILSLDGIRYSSGDVYFKHLNDDFPQLYSKEDVLISLFEKNLINDYYQTNSQTTEGFLKHLEVLDSNSSFKNKLVDDSDFFGSVISCFDNVTALAIYQIIRDSIIYVDDVDNFIEANRLSIESAIENIIQDNTMESIKADGEDAVEPYLRNERDNPESVAEEVFDDYLGKEINEWESSNPDFDEIDISQLNFEYDKEEVVSALKPESDNSLNAEGLDSLNDISSEFEDLYKNMAKDKEGYDKVIS